MKLYLKIYTPLKLLVPKAQRIEYIYIRGASFVHVSTYFCITMLRKIFTYRISICIYKASYIHFVLEQNSHSKSGQIQH